MPERFRIWQLGSLIGIQFEWNRLYRATFQQLATTFHVVNGVAVLYNLGFVSAEYVEFSGPGAGVSVNNQRAVEPA